MVGACCKQGCTIPAQFLVMVNGRWPVCALHLQEVAGIFKQVADETKQSQLMRLEVKVEEVNQDNEGRHQGGTPETGTDKANSAQEGS